MNKYGSWGNYPYTSQNGSTLKDRFESLPESSFLPYGLGRSYGDSCLNSEGQVLSSAALNHFIHFDPQKGVLRAEAGVSLYSILQTIVPHGWFLPVSPGSKYVTLAGAIANDVHGKNHHLTASLGNHVNQFELLRSDGSRFVCSEEENSEYYYATIGGLGLTGFITWAEIQLKPIKSTMMDVESIKYQNLAEFFQLAEDSASQFEYTAVWLDSSAKGVNLGRGHFLRANHAESPAVLPADATKVFPSKQRVFPVTPPLSLVNNFSVKVFNQLYFHRQKEEKKQLKQHFNPFFYPLDGILHWNRMYGKKGFLQYQCIIPQQYAEDGIKALLEKISASSAGSFLVVLKTMGDIKSKGLLSFCRSGANLAIDFPFKGEQTLRLMNDLDEVVKQAGGALYPAKDARMSAEIFQQAYPSWQKVETLRDPNIRSDFWARVSQS